MATGLRKAVSRPRAKRGHAFLTEPAKRVCFPQEIAREPAVAETLFEILGAQRILAGKARIALLPGGPHSRMLANLLAAEGAVPDAAGPGKA